MIRIIGISLGILLALAAPLLAAPLRVLPLGDSITHGITSRGTDGGYSYRYWLWQRLVDAGVEVDFVGSLNTPYDSPLAYPAYQGQTFDPDHEGHYGWSTRMINENLPAWLTAYDADVALIHLGHNDYWREIAPGNGTYTDTVNHLTNIIQSLRADNPNIIVLLAQVVASNPDQPPEGPAFPTAHINMLNSLVPTIAAAATTATSPVIVVDQHTGFNPLTMIYDGVHTNALGEQRMADIWWQAIAANATLAGDYNADGAVDAADYTVWRDALGSTKTLPGDSTPGDVGVADYEFWKERFSSSASGGGGAVAAVPEPSTLAFTIWSAIAGLLVTWSLRPLRAAWPSRISPQSCHEGTSSAGMKTRRVLWTCVYFRKRTRRGKARSKEGYGARGEVCVANSQAVAADPLAVFAKRLAKFATAECMADFRLIASRLKSMDNTPPELLGVASSQPAAKSRSARSSVSSVGPLRTRVKS